MTDDTDHRTATDRINAQRAARSKATVDSEGEFGDGQRGELISLKLDGLEVIERATIKNGEVSR